MYFDPLLTCPDGWSFLAERILLAQARKGRYQKDEQEVRKEVNTIYVNFLRAVNIAS
jgi:hypothetical protein